MLKIWKAKAEPQKAKGAAASPGTVLEVGKDSFTVLTGEGILRISELQIPGKKRMEASAFLRGYTLETGTVFNCGSE